MKKNNKEKIELRLLRMEISDNKSPVLTNEVFTFSVNGNRLIRSGAVIRLEDVSRFNSFHRKGIEYCQLYIPVEENEAKAIAEFKKASLDHMTEVVSNQKQILSDCLDKTNSYVRKLESVMDMQEENSEDRCTA